MALKTDYKDDIPVSERRKYQMVDNGDGTVSFVDVTKYSQEGDTFGAADINATNGAVNEKFDSGDVVDPMETTESGFAADALAVKNQFDEQNKKITINNYPYSYPILTAGSSITKQVIFQTVFMEFDITTNDSADGISKLAFSFDKNEMNIQNYYGGVACPQVPYSAVSGQEASWNCDMQCYVHKDSDGVYVRLRHGKTHNMRVSVFVILQFNVPY